MKFLIPVLLIAVSASAQPSNTSAQSASEISTTAPELTADLLSAHQHYAEAISAYTKLEPRTAAVYNKIGLCYEHMSLFPQAQQNYEAAIKLDANYAPAINNLGTVYYQSRSYKQAERLYHRAIKLDQQNAAFWGNLGAVYLANKKYSNGAEAYQHAFSLNSNILEDIDINGILARGGDVDLAKMNLTFAQIYADAGMKAQAIAYLQRALRASDADKADLITTVRQDQRFAILHNDPAYQQLLSTQPKK
jgi:tetratricopeptide (TPR) repeat protein